jgi:CRP-like cAMP-binding protein
MVVKAMWSKEVNKDTDIITEGEAADNFFVVEHGEFEVEKKGEVVASIGPWELVGELAIMYCFATCFARSASSSYHLFHP